MRAVIEAQRHRQYVGAKQQDIMGKARPIGATRLTPARHLLRWQRIGATFIGLCCVATLFLSWAWNTVPPVDDLSVWVHQYDAAQGAPYTTIDAIAPIMPQALVAIEDERFYQHHGLDTVGLLRAMFDNIRARHFIEGGSTLTAQLAKNSYLRGNDRSATLKLQDLMLAVKIDHSYTKSQIMEFYLNNTYYGDGAYGIGGAAQHYFGISAARLDLAQAAVLAGILQAPSYDDPWCHPLAARSRQASVIDRMLADGMISSAQAAAARAEQLPFWQSGGRQAGDSYCQA